MLGSCLIVFPGVEPAEHAPERPAERAATNAAYPFAVGETLEYEAKIGIIPAGQAVTRVTGTATEGGEELLVLSLTAEGGAGAMSADVGMTSWVGGESFTSRRFHRRSVIAGRSTTERFRILPDSGRYRLEGSNQAWRTPERPLDELAFLYYLRTLPLTPGDAYTIRGYFKTGYNPVRVKVTGRERIELGSGNEVRTLALTITAAGLTSRVWITDDPHRRPARLRLPTPMGTVTLVLVR